MRRQEDRIRLDRDQNDVLRAQLNSEMEKLALEEQELWRNIKERHYNISEEDIISSVKERLIRENLS